MTESAAPAEPTIAILVLGCLLHEYTECIAAVRSTWGACEMEGVNTFYVYGGQAIDAPGALGLDELLGRPAPVLDDGAVRVMDDIILCGAADLLTVQRNCILRKRLIAFGHLAIERSYDFVYAVCASSYVDVPALKRYVAALPTRTGVYHGPLIVDAVNGYPFVSGASLLMSRDVAAALADHADEILATYPETIPDDVVFGHFIADRLCAPSVDEIAERIRIGQKPTDGQMFVIQVGCRTADFVMASEADQHPWTEGYHYHFHSLRSWEMEHFHQKYFAG